MDIHFITLGCPKNIADSEILEKQLQLNHINLVSSPVGSDAVIINTCGFIQDAKEESLETIFNMIHLKKEGSTKRVYVMGCLYERYKVELRKEISEVDGFFGVNSFNKILHEIGGEILSNKLYQHHVHEKEHVAYIKVSDGCNHKCSFCAIPKIKGKYKSKSIKDIISEAKYLVKNDIKEIILVAQDTTYYGIDLYGKRKLNELLKELLKIKNIGWLRLMYTFPSMFPTEILEIMLDKSNFCKYIDIPVQHISDSILKSMRRGINRKNIEILIQKIREKIPNIALRTSLIVGYPGEGKKQFNELLQFVKDTRFERLGVFTYSAEDSTRANNLQDSVTSVEKNERKELILDAQRHISHENNNKLINKSLKILIDDSDIRNYFGRTEWDAPEIDNNVILKKNYFPKNADMIGKFITAKIYKSSDYDIYAKPIL